MFKYNVFENGDTVTYCYDADFKFISIKNDSLNMQFELSIRSSPYYDDPESGFVADIMNIFCQGQIQGSFSLSQVFNAMIDQRTYPFATNSNEIYAEMNIFGKTFLNVEKTNFIDPKLVLFYNPTEGIVGFNDLSGKSWRFEEME